MEAYSLHLPDTYNSTHRQRLGSSRTRKLGKKSSKKEHEAETDWETIVRPAKPTKRVTGSVGKDEAGKKTNATQDVGGKSVSE